MPPFAGSELPENGEGPDDEQGPRRQTVPVHRLAETEQVITAVYFKTGDHHGDDEQGL